MTIKHDVTSEIDTFIDGMVTGGGFSFNYDNVNEHRPGSKTYPNVISSYEEEEFLDPDDQMVDSYTGLLSAKFRVTVDESVSPPRLALSQVLQDFQKLLEDKHDLLQTEGWIKGELISDTEIFTNVRKRPGVLEMEWGIEYRVKRSDPTTTT